MVVGVVRMHYQGTEPLSLSVRPRDDKPLSAGRLARAFAKSYATKYPRARDSWVCEAGQVALSLDARGDEVVTGDVEATDLFVVRVPSVHDELLGLRCGADRLIGSACYLGGSITEQKAGWRPRFHAWLEGRLGRSVRAVNAFCGNAGSTLLAFAARDWVVASAPDLVFIEVAINDGDTILEAAGDLEKERAVGRALEGIVRAVRDALPETIIVFVEMFLRDDLATHRRSGTRAWVDSDDPAAAAAVYHRRVVDVHASVARAYGAALVNLVPSFAAIEPSERDRYFRDDCHHTEAGAALAASLVADCFDRLLRIKSATPKIPEPLDARFWRTNGARRFDADRLSRGPVVAHRAVADRCPVTGEQAEWLWLYPGDALECAFVGRALALVTYVGPDTGLVRVVVDGGPATLVDLVDQWCYYWRLSIALLWTGSDGDHRATISVDQAPPNRAVLKRPISDPNYLHNPVLGKTPKLWLRWYAAIL
ncbi:hypothetical protein CTAYLR_006450 [Chrysophaeum taylorii]|uniref:SGNH hydrolase-type esterase domain-containing protein n=1 Tax=Chrysophaeum taylorii TaxID=2483200 RepID=A0AAD7XQF6_9STRA|nr:hypothetical protein CTAYLR_006450 [Chrysophaeum taylorii]